MIDQSHNVTDPIESLMQSAIELQRAYAQALIVDRAALGGRAAGQRRARRPSRAEARLHHRRLADPRDGALRAGGAIAPIETYRASGYRAHKTEERPPVAGTSAGIV